MTPKMPASLAKAANYAPLILLCAVFSPLMLYLGFASAYDDLRLRSQGVLVRAAVTDSHAEAEDGPEGYSIKYAFRLEGDPTRYSHADRTGRRDLWCPVGKAQWPMILEIGRVDVLYLPDDPWVNRPLYGGVEVFNSYAAVCMGICPWLLVILGLWVKRGSKNGGLRRRLSATPSFPVRIHFQRKEDPPTIPEGRDGSNNPADFCRPRRRRA
ncbi:MAG: hypothetical protein JW929_08170 [Anaerolineales bacterium]|nr:hypothetical protein [Anaerolineales bacterium]